MSGWTPLDRTPRLEGRYVVLEPLDETHVEGLYRAGTDPTLWRWTTQQVDSPEAMALYVAAALLEREEGRSIPFAQVDRATGQVVGSTRLGNLSPEHRRVEIGWTWVGVPWQRTAINTEAKRLLLGHAFEVLDCIRVELKTDALNHISRAAILRLGAVEEGTLRRHMITGTGRVRDTVYFSILREEWPGVREGLDARLAAGLGN
jgi:N-acetyltransferase